jgi:hypothetical protein
MGSGEQARLRPTRAADGGADHAAYGDRGRSPGRVHSRPRALSPPCAPPLVFKVAFRVRW